MQYCDAEDAPFERAEDVTRVPPIKAPTAHKIDTQDTRHPRDQSHSGRPFEYQQTIHSFN